MEDNDTVLEGNDVVLRSEEAPGSGETSEGSGEAGGAVRIAAFDCGNTTGWALYDDGALVQGVAKGREAIYDFIMRLPPDLSCLAYEQFVVRQALKEDHATVLYANGAVEFEAHRRGVPVYRYIPAVSKRRVSNDMLERMGWWPRFGLRSGGHAADATRILVCTLIDEYPQVLMDRRDDNA